jgi:hypothetical protein
VAALFILAVPIVDTVTVMVRRKMKGKSPFHPDKGHFHHILLRMGLNKKDSVRVIHILTAMFSALAIIVSILKIHDAYLFIIFLSFFVMYFMASFYLPELLRYKLRKIGKEEFGSLTELLMKLFFAVTGSQNRRLHKRYTINLPFSIEAESQKDTIVAQSLDIGTGGLSTKLSRILVRGQEVRVNLFIHNRFKRKKISLQARVVWIHQGEGGYYHYGLKFVEIERNQFHRLRRFLSSTFEEQYKEHMLSERHRQHV